jgi:photosystem II stability/assembly factor-like uncharacterized protein
LSSVLAEGKPAPRFLQTVALVAAAVLTIATVGILVMARNALHPIGTGPASSPQASSSPTPTPTPLLPSPVPGVLVAPSPPIVLPDSAQLSAPSSDVVWTLVHDTYLYRSTDRGLTWVEKPMPPGGQAGAGFPQPEIAFVSDAEGWLSTGGSPATQCSTESVTVWHTADAGATWQKLGSTGIADAQCKHGLSFVDPTHGLLAAWDDSHAPVIYRTTDGGVTWSASQPLPDPPGFTTEPGGFTLHAGLVQKFGSELLVTANGNSARGGGVEAVFHSTDGGATWTYIATAHDVAVDLVFVSASRWLQLIGPGLSFETTDSGASWHKYASDYSQAAPVAPQLAFGDTSVGYATVRGGIQVTLDGGLHWTDLKTPGT